jgi:uncharacterized hydrophobic protein (TIGR00271 family)
LIAGIAAKPITRLGAAALGFWRRLTSDWAPYIEDPVPEEEVLTLMQQASIPSFGFFFMLAMATAIATFGMLANSAPAIIGAMIIAPLMAPIMSLAFGVVDFDRRLIARSAVSVFSGVVLVVVFAYATTLLFGLRIAGSEVLSRTAPSLLDLGVAVAAGAAAAFSYTRRSIVSSIAGVAIAVALVPPLAVCGIGLALGRQTSVEAGLSLTELGLYSGGSDIAKGAFVLFLTNLIGIVAVGIAVFAVQRYGHWKKALIGLVLTLTLSALLIQPLGLALHRLYVKSTALRILATLGSVSPETFAAQAKIESVAVTYRGDDLYIYIDAIAPREVTENLQEKLDDFRQVLAAILEEPVNMELDVIPVDLIHVESGPERKPDAVEPTDLDGEEAGPTQSE